MGLFSSAASLLTSFGITAVQRLRRGPRRPGWSFREEALFSHLRRIFRTMPLLEAPAQRRLADAQVAPSPVMAKVRIETVGSGPVRGEWITPRQGAADAVILYFHGGGYVIGSAATHRELAARAALAAGARAFLLDYRLAPEHRFPCAVDDAVAAVRWLRANGTPMNEIVLSGDSAGGGLSLAALLSLRDAGEPLPAGAALICPWIDLEMASPSVQANAPFDWLDLPVAKRWAEQYASGCMRDPRASPLHADLRGLPPLLIQVGTAEVLHDECLAFAELLRKASVRVDLQIFPEMVHNWHMLAQLLPQGRVAFERIGAFVREVTSTPAPLAAPVDAAAARIPR